MKEKKSKLLAICIGLSFILGGCDSDNGNNMTNSSTSVLAVNFPASMEEFAAPYYELTLTTKSSTLPLTGYYLNEGTEKKILLLNDKSTIIINYIKGTWQYDNNSKQLEGSVDIAMLTEVPENEMQLKPGSYFFGAIDSMRELTKVSFELTESGEVRSISSMCSLESLIDTDKSGYLLTLKNPALTNCTLPLDLTGAFLLPTSKELPAYGAFIYPSEEGFKAEYIFKR